jgi:hypothetical protein
MTARDYRDDVIETLAASEAALREQVDQLEERAVRAESARDAFQMMVLAWGRYGYAHHLQDIRKDAQIDRLINENRALRAAVMMEGRSNAA